MKFNLVMGIFALMLMLFTDQIAGFLSQIGLFGVLILLIVCVALVVASVYATRNN